MKTLLIIALIIFIIWLFVKWTNIDHEEKTRQISGELRVKYPNFVRAIRSVYQNDASLFADNNKAFCYQLPIKTYNKKMGDMYYSIIDTTNDGNKPYVIQVYKGLDGVEINTERYYLSGDNDLEADEYVEIFNELGKEIMSDKRYLQSVTRIFL